MLYKNDEIYKLDPKEIKALEDYFHGKFPVKLVYPSERIKKSRLPHNRLPDKPASICFDFKATVKTDKGTEIWRYAENILVDNYGKKTYMPAKFMYEGTVMLERNDIEKIYFLLKKSEFCQGGDNQGDKIKFRFEDLVSEAEKRVEKKKLQQKVDALIYGDLALPEEKLREVAVAYFIDVDNLTLSQVRISLDDLINKTKDGPQKFFDMVDADEELAVRSSLYKAIKTKLLYCNPEKKTWYWKVEGGKDVQVLKVPANIPNATEALYDYYKGNKEFQDDVQALLISKKSPVKKTADV